MITLFFWNNNLLFLIAAFHTAYIECICLKVRMCDSVDKCLIQENGSTSLSGQPIRYSFRLTRCLYPQQKWGRADVPICLVKHLTRAKYELQYWNFFIQQKFLLYAYLCPRDFFLRSEKLEYYKCKCIFEDNLLRKKKLVSYSFHIVLYENKWYAKF